MTKEEIEKQIHDFALRINSMGFLDGYSKGLDDRKKEIEKAKREGYDEGVTDTIFNTDTYIQGLNDAWECAKNIINSYNCNCSDSIPKYADIFGEYLTVHLFDISASEAIAKIKEYEDKHKRKCKECKWDEFRDAQSPVGTPCDSCFEGKNFSPKVARCCSILDDICPYDIKCEECEVHCSVERAKQKLKGDKEK